MTTKTYRAPNMLAALQIVQKELGADAIVLSMRQVDGKSGWQFWQKGGCEVIAMPRQAGANHQTSTSAPAPTGGALADQLVRETAPAAPRPASQPIVPPAMRRMPTRQARQMYQAKDVLTGEDEQEGEILPVKTDLPSALQRLQDHLEAQGVDPSLIGQVMITCARVVNPLGMHDATSLDNLAHKVMEAQVKTNSRPNTYPPTRIMCMMGPSGSGKTSVCAKLAYAYAKKLAKKVVWISADTIRTGAISETRAYTDSLGIQLELAYTPEELANAVISFPDADLILVDTPRCNPFRESSLVEIAPYLTRIPGRSTYLVLPATMKDTDLRHAQASFRAFSPRGTIVTKLDETSSLGSVYNLACQGIAPLTYMTAGTQSGGGLQTASAEILVDALVAGRFDA
jgi:flagellar biosynthesis protein FlhF